MCCGRQGKRRTYTTHAPSNMDIWTETYSISFYLNYLSRWPDLCLVQEAPNGRMMGYVLGKAEGPGTDWHGHVTAITVASEYRRLSLAKNMMRELERISDEVYRGYFVDLYVRCANFVAITMYENMGYSVFRRVKEYYGKLGHEKGGRDFEDAFDMRKPLPRDPERRSIRANGRDVIISRDQAP